MTKSVDHLNPGIDKRAEKLGYKIIKIEEIKERGIFYYELEHSPTGAKHIHLSCGDSENTFSVAFKTVPVDSTGVAHILEHTVLCGSDKYPVRDPFFSMLKRSLSTFMNAFTASDWTMYPFSTQNKKDFYNLCDVYLDAAFFPKIDELSFKQEGCRLETEGDSNELVYKGVVYNEMKGVMSSPDQVMVRSLLNAMYPDTTYSYNSGGDPAVIPSLTYDQLCAFHRRHYHPSNAFFYTYGNLPLIDHLLFIHNKVLKNFTRIDPKTQVPSQPRWNAPQNVTYPFPLGKHENAYKKYQVCVAWLTADVRDTFEVLTLSLLAHILLGNSASPLRKALIDSGLGSAFCDGAGFDSDNRDTMFVAGLKDVEESSASEIESIVFDVLENLSKNGIDKEIIESAIHQLEFHRKEVTNTPYPYGIKLLLSICSTWFHGGDPERILRIDTDLQKLRDELEKGNFFENRIRKYFLDNTHRVLFTLKPDKMLAEKEKKMVLSELRNIKAKMTEPELEKIRKDAKALEQLQLQKEDISCLPTLELKEIPPYVKSVKETKTNPDIPVVLYDQPTSGIFYFSAVFSTSHLDEKLVPLVPFFCRAFPKMSTKSKNYTQLAKLIDRYTGGITLSASARTGFDDSGSCLPYVSVRGKSLDWNQEKMFEIIEELLTEYVFSDITRLKNLLLEFKSDLESMVIHNGHKLAMQLASRNFSSTSKLSETWSGIHQLKTIKEITDDLTDDKLESLSCDLFSIGKNLFARNNIKTCMIGGDKALDRAFSFADSVKKGLTNHSDSMQGRRIKESGDKHFVDEPPCEGWSTSSAVSFVAQAFKTVRLEHEDAPAMAAISKILRSMYLHREIRERGGAYGGFAVYNSEDGLFCLGSYRDPHIVSTLRVYEKASDFIRKGDYTKEDVKEAILQVCSEIDKPDPPGPAAMKAFYRKIISLSDEKRNLFKKKLLSLNKDRIMEAAEKHFGKNTEPAVAVISGEDKLKEANKKLSKNPLKLFKI